MTRFQMLFPGPGPKAIFKGPTEKNSYRAPAGG